MNIPDPYQRRVAVSDGEIHVCQDGPPDAPVLVLIHGSAASVRSWDWLVPELTGSHHVIRVDLLGCGDSGAPPDADYTVPAQARRVAEVLDRLGAGPAVVVGHSSGGLIGTELAARRPDLVTALVLVNTGPSLDAYQAADSDAAGLAQWPPTDEQLRALASTGFRAGYEIPAEFVAELRRIDPATMAATLRAGTAYLRERTLPDRLAVLDTPLLVLFGTDDRRWRAASAADYRAVPGARVELLPGLGHTPIIEDPARTAAPLLAFADRFSVRRTGYRPRMTRSSRCTSSRSYAEPNSAASSRVPRPSSRGSSAAS